MPDSRTQRRPPLYRCASGLARLLALGTCALPHLFAQNCPQEARSDLAPPAWSPIVTAQSPGTYFEHQDGTETIRRTAVFPAYSVFDFPASPYGSFSATTFPDEAPWAFNGGVPGAVCPGPPEADCTGKQIWRYAGSLVQSRRSDKIKGFQFLGSFEGGLTYAGRPGYVQQVVFFHETPVYWGHSEYGIYRDVGIEKDARGDHIPSRLVFYWSSNSNCGAAPFCRSKRGGGNLLYENGDGPLGEKQPLSPHVHGCTVPVPDMAARHLYQVWIFHDTDGIWKFRVEVRDPADLHEIIPGMTVEPSLSAPDPWFPIARLTPDGGPGQGSGYVTAGVVRVDPGATMTYTTAPRMTVEALSVGKNSAEILPASPHLKP